MLRTWTDTHYKLEDDDWLYIATHEEQSSASLVCPRLRAGWRRLQHPLHPSAPRNVRAFARRAADYQSSTRGDA